MVNDLELPPENKSDFEALNHPVAAHVELAASNQETAAIADLLTREESVTAEELSQLEPITNPEVIRERAVIMRDALKQETENLRPRVAELGLEDPPKREKIDAVLSDNSEAVAAEDLDFQYIQFDKVIAAMLVGKPPVEIETVGPYLAAHVEGETGTVKISMANLRPDEAIGIQMAAVFRHLAEGIGGVKIVSLLDEFNTFAAERGFTEAEQDAYITSVAEFFGEAGVIMPDDKPGEDFVLLRESDQLKKFDSLKSQLMKSGNGEIVQDAEGNTYFTLKPEFIAGLGIKSKNRLKEFRQKGILLSRHDGAPTCQALDACSYLASRNRRLLHVVMLDKSMQPQQDKTYALLRALKIVSQDTYHNTFFDSEGLPPEAVVYAVTRTMQNHIDRLLKRLEPQQGEAAA